MSGLELLAMLSGILGVWLTIKQSIWCFPIGIVNVALYAWIFFSPEVRLYADSVLQLFYIVLLTYGWWKWKHPPVNKQILIPEFSNFGLLVKLSALVCAGTLIVGWFFNSYTDASLPWLDSFLTSGSLAAQYLIARKKIENWIIWIVVDVIYIPMYIYKGLLLTAVLYAVFLVLAIKGLREWKLSSKKMHA
ncbi:MAG: nicotinamide riboside transporter PnuC [Bacteroidetes bacterium]|nr:MAG: nicotinamide riboside transporter PnuC [Bacteroidota bacterium]REK00387.1 MAG: nicotinamide riboside transporter PnuC [Bacteroidota bacterium]REK35506.1 MAG: nicotinamide riboside transporter PnuC [Bacteroidota bacterium]REK46858.1 MAG: nicotinamide riboside transporter PnuC [Bacteroidota bacterium]